MFKTCAILGATGLVGAELIKIFNQDKNFQFENLILLSYHSQYPPIAYKNKLIKVTTLDKNNIPKVDILFSSAPATLSKEIIPKFLEQGSYVIDDSSAFRLENSCALVICGINDYLISKSQKLYAQPNCVIVGISYPIFLLFKNYKIKKIYISTYQSISGAGKNALNDFNQNLKNYIENKNISLKFFQNDPILNAIPVIPDTNYQSNIFENFTQEEEKLILELNKVLQANLDINPACVRISTLRGHCANVFVELEEPHPLGEIETLFKSNPYIEFSNSDIFTPKDAAFKDKVFICRLKLKNNVLSFWAVWDNLRIGAALNMYHIFKKLLDS
jgi:aspartate-semialdehyde dehydrogenase